jgi:hypothetical protein
MSLFCTSETQNELTGIEIRPSPLRHHVGTHERD